ncbi:MAG: hypothetical protein U9O94_00660 [Nanoarchaeota archaeon]|nr:hypothetical protein [Nanoarchaeota archaeon]
MGNKLLKILGEMVKKEKAAKYFKSKLRIKGEIIKKSLTKNKNIKLQIQCKQDKDNVIVLKTHKGRYKLAETLMKGNYVSAEGIPKLRWVLCTKLKKIERIDLSKQDSLEKFY